MALLEGDERSEMPSMSWNSVVTGRSAAPVADADADDETNDGGDAAPPLPASPPPVVFNTAALTADAPMPAPVAPVVAPSAAPISEATATVATVPPPPPIPEPAPTPAPTPAAAAPEALPEIVEATPPPIVASQIAFVGTEPEPASSPPEAAVEPVEVAPAAAQSAPTVTPTVAEAPAPVLAPVAQPSQKLSLPSGVAAQPSVVQHVAAPAKTQTRPPRKDRSRSVARVGFFLLIVGALASAAVIFGRPYMFPAEWDASAAEYSEPIEAARGTEFAEPVLLTPQPTEAHRSMVAAQLLGDPQASLPMWRALGLAGPDSTDDATLHELISEQAHVLYSTVDGQVYYDEAFTRSDRAALISQAMATAALDQEFAFSADAPSRSLDDAAMTEATVQQQATLISQAASSRSPLPVTDMAALAFLPAVLDYELTAPVVFADLLPPVNEVAPNPLAELGPFGPGPLQVPPIQQIPSTSLDVGDTAAGSEIATDRSFWFLSFASHLDAATAYRMSTQLQSAGLQMVNGANGTCAVATFATSDAATTAALQADLGTWAAATAPEMGASVSALPDASVQLRSCDPGGEYTSNIRFGVARQLIAYRAVELAVTNTVVAQGGSPAEIAAAIARIPSTPSAAAVAELPAGTAPAELAAAAQAAANDVITPPPPVDASAPVDPAAPVEQAGDQPSADADG